MGAYNIVNPASMVAGQPEDVSQVLANFQAIAAILNGGVDNSNLSPAAAIAYTKLALSASIVNADISPAAAIASTKISGLPAGAFAPRLCRLYRANATPFSCPSGGYQNFPFDTKSDEVGTGMWSAGAPDHVVIVDTGYYLVVAIATFAANATGYREVAIPSGDATILATSVQGNAPLLTAVSVSYMTAGSNVWTSVAQNTGAALGVTSPASQGMSVTRVA